MHSSPDAVPDPETPWQPAPCARRGVVVGLLVTGAVVVVVAAAAAAAAAFVVVRYWAVQGIPASAGPAPTPIQRGGPELPPDDPQQQGFPLFGQLVAEDVLLTDGPLGWYSDPGLDGVSLSPGVSYDKNARQLEVTEAGVYYVFLQAELRRVAVLPRPGSDSGSVSLALHLQPLRTVAAAPNAPAGPAALTLTVHLPPASSEAPHSVSGFRSRLLHLGPGQRLGVHLSAGPEAHQYWQLDQRATVLGLFQVATEVPAALPSPRPT
ncbi:tumor necrosis factor ligand superfamily member 9 [Lemur catta]|uniref:tumor necrosis factor ligand superfamily member 9 n=1 Tax=Lemur catta TaxID=9447 RepID=UPI001E266759|nr:tumor necrosis factor ligand superfamily member 9 [Lemur catta]